MSEYAEEGGVGINWVVVLFNICLSNKIKTTVSTENEKNGSES